MYLFGLLIGIFFMFIGYRKHRITPLFIFSLLWSFILFLSALRLYNLDKPSDQGYAVIAIGMLGFGIGYLVFGKFKIKKLKGNQFYLTRDRIIWLLAAITIGLYFIDFMKVIGYLMDGQSLAYIRALSQDSGSILYANRSNLETVIRTFIIQPFALGFQVIVAMEFWNGKKKWFIVDVIIILLRMLSEGSRSLLLYLGMHLIIIFILDNKVSYYIDLYRAKKAMKGRKRYLKIVTLIAIVIIIATTLSRSGDRAIRTTYYYFSMEPTMLSLWIEKVKEYGYGLASINGVFFPILFVIKNLLGLGNYPSYWYNNIFLLINDTDKTWRIISSFDNTQANAYVSIFWFAYLDGGYIGTFLILFIIGAIYSFTYKYMNKYKNKKSICIYAYLLQGLLFSFIRLQFADVSYALGFVFLMLFAFRVKKQGAIYEK